MLHKSPLLPLYQALPSWFRSSIATAYGYRLRRWRYSADTERLVADARQRETWTADQWSAWQQEKLTFLLNHAAKCVPHYRAYWEQRRREEPSISWEKLENWPILERETIRQNPRSFVADDRKLSAMFHKHTSGTTGKPLDLWFSRESLIAHYALMEARCRGWHGLSRHSRWGILGGQLVTSVAKRKPPFWVWNGALHQLYMSSYHLAPDLLHHYLDAIQNYRLAYLLGYTSSLYTLALALLEHPRPRLHLKLIIANAEPVLSYQREAIEKAFGCPLQETYGMTESVGGASQCQFGRMHLWPEEGVVEVLQGHKPAPRGATGDLVLTGLLNPDMPLIRYRIGDAAALGKDDTPCACGRTLPELLGIEGRSDDILLTRDGRRIGRLDPVFKAHLPIREAQIVQETLQRVRLRYVPVNGFDSDSAETLVTQIKSRMGEVDVVLEPMDAIPRERNGKFRSVICGLTQKEKDSVLT